MIQTTQSFEVRGPEVRSVDVVLRNALEKLRSAAPKKLKELRDEVESDLKKLEHLPSSGAGISADDFFTPLKLSCEAVGVPKLVIPALEAIQTLLRYGFLTGKGADPYKQEPGRHLIDTIVESISHCAESADDTVQLHMISALLAAATSQSCEVHGATLVLGVKTCVNIHQDSKCESNRKQAQNALTQMLNVITQRMELSSADMSRRAPDSAWPGSQRQQGAVSSSKQLKEAAAAAPAGANADLEQLPKGQLLSDWMSSYLAVKIDEIVLKQPKGKNTQNEVTPGKFGLCVICREAANHYCLDTRDPVCGHTCKFRNLKRLSLVETYYGGNGTDDQESAAPSTSSTSVAVSTGAPTTTSTAAGAEADAGDRQTLNPYHEDAYTVLTYLCKLSMQDASQSNDGRSVIRSKRIALNLIHQMLKQSGPVFKSSPSFVNILKKLLCDALIKNSVSADTVCFANSLNIFTELITNFKEHLRNEIGVFIEHIFLKILESGNSAFDHKNKVLHVFFKLCKDATTPLELFLNFDCDVDEKNIFERTIDCLSKISQGKYQAVEHANIIQPHQEQELKLLALQALVTLMGSIVDWARRMQEEQKPTNSILSRHIEEGRHDPDSDGEDSKSDAAASLATSGGASAVPHVNTFQEQKQRKLELKMGVEKFNMKPKKGIEYLMENGFIKDDPSTLAELFKNKELGLDKTAIGDYLGEDKPVNKNTLAALTDSLDFKNQALDDSLRDFLSYFRLPGEAQKIDRMMEKFADKYHTDNPERFAHADCAFVLAFSLIMLNTDLHNPGVKNKMTKDAFIKNNRGINNNQDLPREYLESLYDGILTNPFNLTEDQEARNREAAAAAKDSAQKAELFVKEADGMVQKTQEIMKQKDQRKNSMYVTAQSVEHVRPLFEVASWPYLATLAVILETQDSDKSVALCIDGFKHCIRIAARFDMDTERDAFVSSLAKFTYLTTIKEMKQKNIECIKALLSIGLSEGNNLGPAWLYVLHCISQLERLQLIGTRGARQDFQFFQEDDEGAMSPTSLASQRTNASTAGQQVLKRRAHGLGVSALVSVGQDDRVVEMVNSEHIATQIDAQQIDALFNKSTQLSPEAVVHFVRELAKVSKEELYLADQSRIFSLQKLVEVATSNMSRMRVVWGRIWKVLSSHFEEVAAHQNIRVSVYAMDSLRQLTMKFLEKEEYSGFNFQADFLKPFERIMARNVSKDVKDYDIQIIAHMTEASFKHIRSGWKTVFAICAATTISSSSEPAKEATVEMAFSIMEKVIKTPSHYHLFAENFSDGIRTLVEFAKCKAKQEMSIRAIDHLHQAANYLADPTKPDPPPPPAQAGAGAPQITAGGGSHPAAHWFPILRGLSSLVSDPRRDVRSSALNSVFEILTDHGTQVFDEDTWHMVFNGVIKPLFDDIHHQLAPDQHKQEHTGGGEAANSVWPGMGPPTCLAALTALVRLVDAQLDALDFMLGDVLNLIQNCIQHELEAVARIGVEGFKQLLLPTGKRLKPESWQKVTDSILKLFKESMPTKLTLVEVKGASTLPFNKDGVVIQCVVQLLLIDMLQDAVSMHYEHIPESGILTLLDALQSSFEFAQEFNRQIELRQALKRLGFMKEMKQLPGLLKQERESLSCSLKILFQVQSDPRLEGSEFALQAVDRLLRLCSSVIRNYASKEKLLHERAETPTPAGLSEESLRDREAATVEVEREVLGLVPIISQVVVKGLKELPQAHFDKYVHKLFPLFCELTIVNSREVRLMVRDVLIERVNPLLASSTGRCAQDGGERLTSVQA